MFPRLLPKTFLLCLCYIFFANVSFAQCNVIFNQNLKFGDKDENSGNQVSAMQNFLATQNLGLKQPVSPTGYFGNYTAYVLYIYQRKVGIIKQSTKFNPKLVFWGPKTYGYVNKVCSTQKNYPVNNVLPIKQNNSTTSTTSTSDIIENFNDKTEPNNQLEGTSFSDPVSVISKLNLDLERNIQSQFKIFVPTIQKTDYNPNQGKSADSFVPLPTPKNPPAVPN
jgi:hypothetical protein